ncbi:MAG: hypothetical protein ACRDRT_18915 [Pseudonocardiaceae bacterium]
MVDLLEATPRRSELRDFSDRVCGVLGDPYHQHPEHLVALFDFLFSDDEEAEEGATDAPPTPD